MGEPNRKLAAILSADVVGYSRLMQADDRATVATLKDYRAAVGRIVARHAGRVVNTPGDSILVAFASATAAVRTAVEIQRDIERCNADLPEDRRMRFRIGVHLGDVIEEEDGALYGDGVNIAARIEALADGAGICVSSTVYDAISNKLGFGFEFIGERQAKNIAEPVRVYRLRADAQGGQVALPSADLRRAPAIAVLPFTNMSDDPAQEYFADGITEDLITELSRFDGLLVIARNSTFRFKGQTLDVGEVGRALGVRYLLEGGVRRAGGRVRITAQLIDAATGGHLWAERYDRELTDIFAVQDDVTRQIVAALRFELGHATATRANRPLTTSPEAYDLYLRGRVEKDRRLEDANARAQALFEQAISLDPSFAAAHAELAETRYLAAIYGCSAAAPALNEALALAERAVALDPALPVAYAQLGRILGRRKRVEEGIAAAYRAVALDTNYAYGYTILSLLHSWNGDVEQALAMADKAIRLDPYWFGPYFNRGMTHFVRKDYPQAIADFKTSLALNAEAGWPHMYLAATYGLLGRHSEARAEAATVARLHPDFMSGLLGTPFKDSAVLARLANGLRKVGLEVPEEAAANSGQDGN